MEIPLLQVDAFASQAFKGNPAAVCLLESAKPADWMQNVGAEMNLAETAFVVPRAEEGQYDLRWFTPAIEIPLCGHATLASAHALWETGRLADTKEARFHTMSGELICRRAGKLIEVHSGIAGLEGKTMRLVHWILDPESGKPWASMEAVALTFDTTTRKAITPSPEAVKRIKARIVKMAV